ncbi:hypothetical protein FRB94_000749 [Tulasnella sp. JGI-2019a]|nr:hypothetical protein FRB93_002697 [Tulasnella sp. JGI-2019a]KAG9013769.1 hypothetical protein FRB94_000749 [Tulasnella sp. JGI-2019a]
MDPLEPTSFNLKNITLATGRKYEYCDQTPTEYKHGETPILLLLHGFPEFWYEWRYQIGPWVRRGWRVVVPNMLGYCGTDKPADPALYTPLSLSGEMPSFLDALDIKHPVVLVAHEWGSTVACCFAMRYPERTKALVSFSVLYQPAAPKALTVSEVVEAVGNSWLGYWHFFTSDDASAKIQSNIPLFIDALYRSHKTVHPDLYGAGTIEKILSGEIENPGPSDLMSDKERQIYIKALETGGIDGPLNYFRQISHQFAIQEALKSSFKPVCPATLPILLLAAEHEPFGHPDICERTKEFAPSVEIVRLDSAHFIMLEKRDEVTQRVGDWLEKVLTK